jgi:hypothetical protein
MMRPRRGPSQATWVDDVHTPRPPLAAVHLAVLWGFAVAQPYFDVVGSTPAFFAVRGSEPLDIVLFAVGLVVVPPLAMVAIEALAGLVDARLRSWVHSAFVAVLAAAIALQALERLWPSSSGRLLIALAVVAGTAFALAYARRPAVRSVATVLGPAPLLFCVLFLFFSPVTRLLAADEGARVARVDSRVPVVMVVFDELPVTSLLGPDGRVDAARYPNFADLARHSTWYRNTATVDSATEQAVPALLDGRWPRAERLPTLGDHPHNLFTLLGSSHRLHVAEPVTRLCPQALCGRRADGGVVSRLRSLVSDSRIVSLHLLLPRDLREGLPSISDRWQGFGDADPVADEPLPAPRRRGPRPRSGFAERFADAELDRQAAVERFLDGIRPQVAGERPPLHFLHAMFPHSPWQYLPSGRQFSDATSRLGQGLGGWSRDPFGPLMHFQRHLLQVGFTDRLLGLVLDRLRAARLFERSLVVVVADHGVSFRGGQRSRGVSRGTAPDVVPVPLFVKAPGQRSGEVIDAQVRTIDVLPTIADLLGVRMPWPVDGRSAVGAAGVRPIALSGAGAGRLAFAPAWIRARREAALRRQVALFGHGEGRPGIYGLGPHPELLGRRVAGLRVRRSATHADIDQAPVLARVDRRTGFLPTHITGDLSGPAGRSTVDLAVAVNGRIAAVSRTLTGGRGGFSFMVPESALRQGANRVQVLGVPPAGAGTFALLGQTGSGAAPFTLAGDAIRTAGGARIAIGTRVRGAVERAPLVGPVRRLTGWAFDVRAHRPVEHVLAFAGRRLVYDARPRDLRPAVAAALGTDPGDLGWRADVTLRALQAAGGPLRVYGVAGRSAGPLPFVCAGDPPQEPGCAPLRLAAGAIRARGAAAIRITRDGVRGSVDRPVLRGAALLVRGSARRTADGRPVDRIVAFAGGRLLFSGPPASVRFAFDVPSRVLHGDRGRPRVFAVAGRVAVQLPAAT